MSEEERMHKIWSLLSHNQEHILPNTSQVTFALVEDSFGISISRLKQPIATKILLCRQGLRSFALFVACLQDSLTEYPLFINLIRAKVNWGVVEHHNLTISILCHILRWWLTPPYSLNTSRTPFRFWTSIVQLQSKLSEWKFSSLMSL